MRKIAFATLLLTGTALAHSANAATFTSDHCTGNCGPQATGFATITGTQVGTGVVDITINLLNGNGIVDTGLHAFTFNLIGNPTVTFSNFSSPLFDVVNSATNTVGATSIHQDGFGDFEYALDYTGGSGASNPFSGPLSFRLTGTGLTLASFAELSSGGSPSAYLTLDIISGTTGKTGAVDCCDVGITPFGINAVPGPIAGAGLPGLLAACFALFGLNRRRRRNNGTT
jgi:hypothetical protein